MNARQIAFDDLRILFTELIRASDSHPNQSEQQQDAAAKIVAEQFTRIMSRYDVGRALEILRSQKQN